MVETRTVPINPLIELQLSMTEIHDRQKAEGGYMVGETTVGYWLELLERSIAQSMAQIPKIELPETSNEVRREVLDREITL